VIAKKRKRGNPAKATKKLPMGLRWPVERTNSWLSNYGQLRRNTDRRLHTASLSSPSRSPCSSPRSSSTGEPLVADPLTYSLRLLVGDGSVFGSLGAHLVMSERGTRARQSTKRGTHRADRKVCRARTQASGGQRRRRPAQPDHRTGRGAGRRHGAGARPEATRGLGVRRRLSGE